MNIIKTENVNTNNAWGFGGWVGQRIEYDNNLILEKGVYCYRHSKPSSKRTWKVKIGNLEKEVIGNKEDLVAIYKDGENYLAVFTNAPDSYYLSYGRHYKFETTILTI